MQSGGVWNRSAERCEVRVAVNECPAGTSRNANGQCVASTQNPDGVNAQCPSGYYWNGASCSLVTSGVSVTQNPDGTTTVTNHYNQSGEDTEGAGECDPTSADYAECIGQVENLETDPAGQLKSDADATATGLLDQFETDYTSFINGDASLGSDPGFLQSAIETILPGSSSCSVTSVNFGVYTLTIDCAHINEFKSIFGWFLYLTTAIYIFYIAISPTEARS